MSVHDRVPSSQLAAADTDIRSTLQLLEQYWGTLSTSSVSMSDESTEVSAGDVAAGVDSAGDVARDDLSSYPCFGRFHILRLLGQGGFGLVFLAYDPTLKREVALKIPRPDMAFSGDATRRFHREAETSAQLNDPGIVQIHDTGQIGNVPYLVSEYCSGPTLADFLSEHGPQQDLLAARWCAQLAAAVHHAHVRGVLHRDITPRNVLLVPEQPDGGEAATRSDTQWRPKLCDFGLARWISMEQGTRTGLGVRMGTPHYMAPEQVRGTPQDIDTRTDIYGVGTVMWEILLGERLFADVPEPVLFRCIEQVDPPPMRRADRRVPLDLETICRKCLAKSPSGRYQTALELAADLQRYLRGEAIVARRAPWVRRVTQWFRRHPAWALVCGGILLATFIAGVTTAVSRRANQERIQRVRAESLMRQLETATWDQLPEVVHQLQTDIKHTEAVLRDTFASAEPDSPMRLRCGMALLPFAPEVLQDLCKMAETAPLESIPQLQTAIRKTGEAAAAILGKQLNSAPSLLDGELLRLSSLFADIVGSSPMPNRSSGGVPYQPLDWVPLAPRIVSATLTELSTNPALFQSAVTTLQPMSDHILGDLVASMNEQGNTESRRKMAAAFVAALGAERITWLTNVACNTQADVLPIVMEPVIRNFSSAQDELLKIVNAPRPDDELGILESWHRCRAASAAVLLRKCVQTPVWPLLIHESDPRTRSYLIDRVNRLTVGPTAIRQRLLALSSGWALPDGVLPKSTHGSWLFDGPTSEIRGLLHVLGAFSREAVLRDAEGPIEQLVLQLNEFHPDPGVHSSSEWVLRRWEQHEALKQIHIRLTKEPRGQRDWYVDGQGHTLAILHGPIEYETGSTRNDPDRYGGRVVDPVDGTITEWDDEPRQPRRIGRSFAIGVHEVTFEQMNRFQDTYHVRANKQIAPTLSHPATRISWYDAAVYCNWLSAQVGLPESEWCYLPNGNGEYREGMSLARDYLSRTGYRLPTESEWEYACRAGTTTRRYFGDSNELVESYVWCYSNSRERWLLPPGSLLPNEFGLFDMFGNVAEWCLDGYRSNHLEHRQAVDDQERYWQVDLDVQRVLRGATFSGEYTALRATKFRPALPNDVVSAHGFRVARTWRE